MVEKVINSDLKKETSHRTTHGIQHDDDMTLELDFVRRKLEHFHASILREVEKRTNSMIEDVLQELRQHELQRHEFRSFAKQQNHHHKQHQQPGTWSNRVARQTNDVGVDNSLQDTVDATQKQQQQQQQDQSQTQQVKNRQQQKKPKNATLPDKIFVTRQSYLTALLEVDHMRSIYHIFYIILLVLLSNSVFHDYFVEGRVNFGLGTFKVGLQRIHYVLGAWLLGHGFVFALYYAFCGWAKLRNKFAKQPVLQRAWSCTCLVLHIAAQLWFGYAAATLCFKWDLPFVSAAVLLLETTRLLMKMHSFVRINVPRVWAGKVKSDATPAPSLLPSFGCYLYFLFAPTLIYRDNYPRTARIRWRFVLSRFLEVVAIAFIYSYIHERHTLVHFANFGLEPLNASGLLLKFFGMVMPSIIIYLCGFYLILHSWLNFAAELLRFGDRMFYKDWWTASNFDSFYRNWNVVVHDWLYEFVYKDFYTYVFKGSKIAALIAVFLISALVHEFIIDVALQLFFPVLFICFFIVGNFFMFVTRNVPKNIGNILVWFSMIVGNSAVYVLYSMEYHARRNCPKEYNTWVDYLTPAIINCFKN